MEKLISALNRLYLRPGAFPEDALLRQLRGEHTQALSLAGPDGLMRAAMIPFARVDADGSHWTRLCDAANGLQQELGLPAPAVSISGDGAYGLWLSLAEPAPVEQMQAFVDALHARYFPDMAAPGPVSAPLELPPCLHQASGKWAAFIHPGMGASFADEAGLDLPPPAAGQAAFLDELDSIAPAAFAQALASLRPAGGAPQSTSSAAASAPPGARPDAGRPRGCCSRMQPSRTSLPGCMRGISSPASAMCCLPGVNRRISSY
ncbi:hypothetical protein [Massilia sp. KIM]|uniref:hypothetical protein n=1 Tax=Massilia sp. KIM TaxID=1955422 RepID=UPI001E57DC31|nr:hypothetical protein [Massilia sp. KIM]